MHTAKESRKQLVKFVFSVILIMLLCPFNIFSQNQRKPVRPQRRQIADTTVVADTLRMSNPIRLSTEMVEDSLFVVGDSVAIIPFDTISVADVTAKKDSVKVYAFNPDPMRAVWLSALFPGLGQIYNRRYWKLPLIVGGFMGLGYGTSWNNGMLRDYTRAYSDLMDNDPNTKSYMDLFPPTTKESDLDRSWLERTLKSRKDYFRRNRDLCIISMIGVYVLAMVDAYVDASLAHFDITPDLSMQVAPAIIPDSRKNLPGVGLQWAFNF